MVILRVMVSPKKITDKTTDCKNAKQAYWDYQSGQKVMLMKDGRIISKTEDQYLDPFTVTSVNPNCSI